METKQVGCGRQVPFFGAHYPDAVCIEGYLWDLDSCDEPGGYLTHGGDVPCPCCNTVEHVDWRTPGLSGNSKQRRCARRALARKIRRLAIEQSS